MKHLSLLAFTLVLACGGRSNDNNNPLPPTIDSNNVETSGKPVQTSCYKGDEFSCAVEAAIVAKTNAKRASVGLPPLQQSFETSFVARAHSQSMAAVGAISHSEWPEGRLSVLKAEFPNFSIELHGENVASFWKGPTAVEAVAESFVDMWWKSEGHRKNISNRGALYIGVGVVRFSDSTYATQLFHK